MKALKKFFIYLGLIIAVLVAVVLIIFAVMYFAPGTSILGYEYVLYNKRDTRTFTTSSYPSISSVQAVQVVTESTNIYIMPNKVDGELKIVHIQGLSGYAKSINSKLEVKTKVENKSFEESLTSYRTFVIEIEEPNGWIAKSNAAIYVYIPTNLTTNTIYAKSIGGDIEYISEKTYENENDEEFTKTLKCTNLYMKTSDYGCLEIDNEQTISNYYLQTKYGKVQFSNVTNLSANTVKFETYTGNFNLTNPNGNATLTLTDKLHIISNEKYTGAYIRINVLNANLLATGNNGTFKIDRISSTGKNKNIALTMNKCNVDFGEVYGHVSIIGEGSDIKNTVTIKNLYEQPQTNVIESGSGNVYIENLKCSAAIDATSGNVTIAAATESKSSVYVYTTTGSINVNYVKTDELPQDDHPDVKVTAITKTGDINLKNVSGLLQVEVLNDSASSKLNISFKAIAYAKDSNEDLVENVINARNRTVNIVLKGSSDALQSRIVSTSKVNDAKGGVLQSVSREYESAEDKNKDYILNLYEGYQYGYRVYYKKNDANYNAGNFSNWGIILINTTASSSVDTD